MSKKETFNYWDAKLIEECSNCVMGLKYHSKGCWGADKAPRLMWDTRVVNRLVRDGFLIVHHGEFRKPTVKGYLFASRVLARSYKKASIRWEQILAKSTQEKNK